MNTVDDSLREYDHVVELYKYYWRVAMQVSGFYLLAIGAVLSFYVTHLESPKINYLLLFCIFISTGFSFLCAYSCMAAHNLTGWAKSIAERCETMSDYFLTAEPLQVYLLVNFFLSYVISFFCLKLYGCNLQFFDPVFHSKPLQIFFALLVPWLGFFADTIFTKVQKIAESKKKRDGKQDDGKEAQNAPYHY